MRSVLFRRRLFVLPVLLSFAACATNSTAPAEVRDDSAARLRADVVWLADDAQEGRRAGTDAGLRSGEWIARQFESVGLRKAGKDGWFQRFDVPKPVEVLPGSRVDFSNKPDEVTPMFCSTGGAVMASVVWAGYGIVNGEKEWNDYPERAEGKIVLIVRGTPPEERGAQPKAEPDASGNVHESAGWGNSGSLFLKVMNAKRNGAAAVLVAPHPSQQAEPLPAFDTSRSAQSVLPALFVSHAVASRLAPGYDKVILALDAGEAPPALPKLGQATVEARVVRERGPATNVLGLLAGRDSSRCVVIGAHYDHLGHGGEGSLDPQSGSQIHNGADDNASGTAVLIEVARQLAKGPKPDCDVLFAAWSGEELGLLGSEHWAKDPTVALERVVANLNLDMVGRAGNGKLAALGAGSAEPFAPWLAELGPASGLTLEVSLSGQGVGGSDHQTFLKRKIPAVHFFSGLHPDYHKPTDDVERFEADGAAKVARLVHDLVRRIGEAPRLGWVEPPAPAASQPGQARAGGFRVWFGSVPEYSFEGKGVLLAGTSPGSPAEKAGMLAGDVLVQVGDIAIESMQDFMYALQTYKPGDVVLARFQRDGKTEEVRLTLTTREAQ